MVTGSNTATAEKAFRRMKAQNWNRMAERHNAAVESRAPLLASAGLIRPLTAEEIQASYERWQVEREILRQRQLRFAERCRRRVSLRVSEAEMDALDARRAQLPTSSEYGADFWRRVWRACVGAQVRCEGKSSSFREITREADADPWFCRREPRERPWPAGIGLLPGMLIALSILLEPKKPPVHRR